MVHYESSLSQKILLHMKNDDSFSDIQIKASNDEIITAHKVSSIVIPGIVRNNVCGNLR